MPFVRKSEAKNTHAQTSRETFFIGRIQELEFFSQNVLKADYPSHNIVAFSGDGGIGKSTLLRQFIRWANSDEFKEYCVVGLVDENQATPASIMKRLAEQLREAGHTMTEFDKALNSYEEVLRKLQAEREVGQEAFLRKAVDLAGSVIDDVPMVGGLLKEGSKAAVESLIKRRHTRQLIKDAERLEDPIRSLTKAFVKDLNYLCEGPVGKTRRNRRIVLMFDTFERSGLEAAPWLLDYFLKEEVNDQLVLVIAGRDPLLHSGDNSAAWLEYRDFIRQFSLKTFNLEESRTYLAKYRITDEGEVVRMHELSVGLPFFLDLLVNSPEDRANPTRDVVKRFLKWIPEEEQNKRRLALDAALFIRPFNQDDLAAFDYISEAERVEIWNWLASLTFVHVSADDGRYIYHDVARELFSRYLYQLSEKGYFEGRKKLGDYYRRQLAEEEQETGIFVTQRQVSLLKALIQQLLLQSDEDNYIIAIDQIVRNENLIRNENEIVAALQEMSQDKIIGQISISAKKVAENLIIYLNSNPSISDYLEATKFLLELAERSSVEFSEASKARLYQTLGAAYFYSSNKLEEALFYLNKSLEFDSEAALTYDQRGLVYFSQDRFEEALFDFNRAIELRPNYFLNYVHRGGIYLRQDKHQEALIEANRAIELEPKSKDAYLLRAEIYQSQNQYRLSIPDLTQTIELEPKFAWAYRTRGLAYSQLGNFDEAIADFNKALELRPNNTSALTHLANVYTQQSKYREAIVLASRAIELNPKYEWAYSVCSEAYTRQGNFSTAIDNLTQLIILTPQNGSVYQRRGEIYLKLGEYHQAFADLDKAIKLGYNPAWIYAQRGRVELKLEKVDEAKSDFEEAFKKAMDSWYRLMIEWIELLKNPPSATNIKRLEDAGKNAPENCTSMVCIALVHWMKDNLKAALTELEKVIAEKPLGFDGYFWRGVIYAELGKNEEAVKELKRALENDEMSPILLKALQWLKHNPTFYQEYVIPLIGSCAS